MFALLFSALAAAEPSVLVQVSGIDDDCCGQKVATALDALPFLGPVAVAWQDGRACAGLTGALDEPALRAAVSAAGYGVASVSAVDACPSDLQPSRPDPWAGVTALDARVVSRGEAVELEAHAAPGKFTVYDFGAPWCAPCYTTAVTLQGYLAANADVAVRVVFLEAPDAVASFALPAAAQHLAYADAIPWFVVRDPGGRTIYAGSDVERALRTIDKRRGRR